MSDYRYYEFRAIDRALNDRQMRELRAISTRAAISRTSFSNYYTFGDLRADPRNLLTKYFDASLYFANGAVSAQYFVYNFVRQHRTLRVSPAMAAGVTTRLFDVMDLVNLLIASEKEAG
jgi:hypothetical protein